MGVVNLTTTYFQAAGLFRRTSVALGVRRGPRARRSTCSDLQLHGIIGPGGRPWPSVAAVVAVLLAAEIHRTWPGALRGAVANRPCGGDRLRPARPPAPSPVVLWSLWAAAVGGCCSASGRGILGAARSDTHARPRVLHLGYEDPRRPGAGGGSVRTHEINRRLAGNFDITVVCSRYRGARTRIEDGVRYVHVGIAGGDFPERLAYFAALPYALLRYRSDLVVEDFGAPFSSVAVPWMTSRPVLGVVQWLFAAEKSAQYHLPFSWVERVGVRSHRAPDRRLRGSRRAVLRRAQPES